MLIAYNDMRRKGDSMAIVYSKLLKLLQEKGVSSYTVKKSGIIGQATWKKIHEGGHIDTRTINALCGLLDCQPGDILEFIPDKQAEAPEGE